MNRLFKKIGGALAYYLNKCSRKYEPFSVSDPATLRHVLRPGDVLLVEGNRRISVAIKYVTQSTWSHAALYVGDALAGSEEGVCSDMLVESDLSEGVIAAPLSKYEHFNTRICRAVGLTDGDRRQVVQFVIDRLGSAYDLKNVLDLLRYLLPTPPVPVRWRRRLLALRSGDPTRAICSTLIAQAFQSVGYPILPQISVEKTRSPADCTSVEREILHIRHHSLFMPRDFDVSSYFQVIKPTVEAGFDYKALTWYKAQK